MSSNALNTKLLKSLAPRQRVFATGVFDILHIEHITFLQSARNSGDSLVVGIESDARVSKMKGSSRPIFSQQIRVQQISALACVDYCFVLPEKFDTQDDWEQLYQLVSPDIYAVSSNSSWIDNKAKVAQKFNSKLQVVHQWNPDISTTMIATRVLESNQE